MTSNENDIESSNEADAFTLVVRPSARPLLTELTFSTIFVALGTRVSWQNVGEWENLTAVAGGLVFFGSAATLMLADLWWILGRVPSLEITETEIIVRSPVWRVRRVARRDVVEFVSREFRGMHEPIVTWLCIRVRSEKGPAHMRILQRRLRPRVEYVVDLVQRRTSIPGVIKSRPPVEMTGDWDFNLAFELFWLVLPAAIAIALALAAAFFR